jgi:glycosyltransferase involved in cell wall biosynthesis
MSDRRVLVSILVPAYNAARYLPQLCESIRAQSYPHYEVLIGNDGSGDNPAAVLGSFLQDNRFQLLEWQPNRGLNHALGLLCSRMKGEYWCSPGADDLYAPAFLEQRVERMEANPKAFLVHGLPELIDESGRSVLHGPRLLPNLPPQLTPPRSLEVLLQHNIINQPSALVRASLTRQLLPFYHWNWEYGPDWFLWILHAAAGCDLLWDGRVLSKYRVHPASLTCTPEKAHVRGAEVRLVPLVALRTAAQYSQWAAAAWSCWGRMLYWHWLRRALALQSRGGLRPEWVQVAAHAYYGAKGKKVSLWFEVARHSLGILVADFKHRRAQRKQGFPAAGLAQIDDPIFR